MGCTLAPRATGIYTCPEGTWDIHMPSGHLGCTHALRPNGIYTCPEGTWNIHMPSGHLDNTHALRVLNYTYESYPFEGVTGMRDDTV